MNLTIPEIVIKVSYKDGVKPPAKKISTYDELYEVMRSLFDADAILWVEEFIMLCLNSNNEIVGYYKISKGGINSTAVDIRVIATVALQSLASQVVIAHNHPSGNLKPSAADNQLTAEINSVLKLLNIELLDHLIVTNDGYYSYKTEGKI